MSQIFPVSEILKRQEALDRDKETIRKIISSLSGLCEQLSRENFQEKGNYFFDTKEEQTGWMFSMRTVNDPHWLHLGFVVFLVNNCTVFSYDLVERKFYFKTEHVSLIRSKLQDLVNIMVDCVPAVRWHLEELWRTDFK